MAVPGPNWWPDRGPFDTVFVRNRAAPDGIAATNDQSSSTAFSAFAVFGVT